MKKDYILIILFIFVFLILFVKSYPQLSEQTVDTLKPVSKDTPRDKESCEAKGGLWGPIGLSPEERCNLPTSDAGKECSDSDECEGYCVAELLPEEWSKSGVKGQCTAWRIVVGCITLVEDGKAKGICID